MSFGVTQGVRKRSNSVPEAARWEMLGQRSHLGVLTAVRDLFFEIKGKKKYELQKTDFDTGLKVISGTAMKRLFYF